jgi:hypothetical protein
LFDAEGKNAIDLHELKVCRLRCLAFVHYVRGALSISASSDPPLLP